MNTSKVNTMTVDELKQLPYLNQRNYARLTGLPIGYVRGLVKDGRLPCLKSGRTVYVDVAAANAVLHAMVEDGK